jgi:hypothetical protein
MDSDMQVTPHETKTTIVGQETVNPLNSPAAVDYFPENRRFVETPGVSLFRGVLLAITVAPTWLVLLTALLQHLASDRDVDPLGLLVLCTTLMPVQWTASIAQIFLPGSANFVVFQSAEKKVRGDDKNDEDSRRLSVNEQRLGVTGPRMTCVEVVHWGQLILASVIAVGLTPLLLWPTGWWTIALGVTLALTMLCMNIMAICYTSPAMKQAIQVNLNSESALRLFQERIMKNFALVFMFQIFVMALFICPVFDTKILPGQYAGANRTVDLYANGKSPIFVEFARPDWWYGFFLSICCGCLPLLLTVLGGSGIFEAARSTGEFNVSIGLVMGLWYATFLCASFQLANCVIVNFAHENAPYLTPLDALHEGWNRTRTLFFLCLSFAQAFFLSSSLMLVYKVSRLTEELKNGNQWHFFISHYQANGGKFLSVVDEAMRILYIILLSVHSDVILFFFSYLFEFFSRRPVRGAPCFLSAARLGSVVRQHDGELDGGRNEGGCAQLGRVRPLHDKGCLYPSVRSH